MVSDQITERELMRLVLIMAPSFQGGHCKTGAEVATLLGISFPLRMSNLERAARGMDYDPNDLWPWLPKSMMLRRD